MTHVGERPADPALILQLTQLLAGHMAPRAIATAAELELDRLLQSGPRDAAALARDTDTDPDTLYRLLRLLACAGVLVEQEDRTFALTPLGEHLEFARIGFLGEIAHKVWDALPYTLRTGRPAFDHLYGQSFYQFLAGRPAIELTFNEWMGVTAGAWLPAAVAACDLTGARTVVDVGGGDGTFLAALLHANPDLRGVLFDLPEAVARAPAVLDEAGVAGRCEVAGGSFFEAVPPGGDVYTVCRILFNWDDERAAAILRAVRAAMPDSGRLLVVEVPLRPLGDPQRGMGAINDLNVLLLMGGRYRTEEDFRALFRAAGFELTGLRAADDLWFVIEGRPA